MLAFDLPQVLQSGLTVFFSFFNEFLVTVSWNQLEPLWIPLSTASVSLYESVAYQKIECIANKIHSFLVKGVNGMPSKRILRIQIDGDIKTQTEETLAAVGLSMSEAVHLFLLHVIADQALPFEVRVPNARTRAAMREADEIVRVRRARFETADAVILDAKKIRQN